jgi:hypothetical protein
MNLSAYSGKNKKFSNVEKLSRTVISNYTNLSRYTIIHRRKQNRPSGKEIPGSTQ